MFTNSIFFFVILFYHSFGRVYEIYHRDHFHDLLQDLPIGARPASLVAFYNDTSSCLSSLKSLKLDEEILAVEHLLVAQYEMSTYKERIWHEYESHMDFASYIGLNDYINNLLLRIPVSQIPCPILAFIPSSYADSSASSYLNNPSTNGINFWDGVDNTKGKVCESCEAKTTLYSHSKNYKEWLFDNLRITTKLVTLEPYPFNVVVLPNEKNPLISNNKSPKIFSVNPMESYTNIEGFVSDTIFITNYEYQPSYHKIDTSQIIKHPDYKLWPNLNNSKLIVKKLNDIQYGFDIGRRSEISNDLIKGRYSSTCMCHTRNLVFPVVLPHKDPIGFKKIKLPDEIYRAMTEFYKRQYQRREAESWDSTATELNYFDIKSYMISLDHEHELRDHIAMNLVRPLLEEWNGGIELEFTAFYGIREYLRNAVLRNHVDRTETHVFSAILQIGQSDIDSDWGLEVIGFDGKRYQVYLQPGEMALYEGHALIHGRPEPFNGTIFANAFCHFKPKNFKWNTNLIWKSEVGQKLLKKLHISYRDLVRL